MELRYIEKRYNVMGISSISAFSGVKGGMNGNCKDVYFVRMTGVNTTFIKDIEGMDQTQTERMQLGQGVYSRVGTFPKNIGADEVKIYTDCYDQWVSGGRTLLLTKNLKEASGVGEILSVSCAKVLEVYRQSRTQLSDSIEKNFVVKLLFWVDELALDYLKDWNPRQSMKFVAQGVLREQEYLFCYLLTLLGIDVLLLQNAADIDDKLDGLHLSSKLILGEQKDIALETYDKRKAAHRASQPDLDSGASGQASGEAGASSRPRLTIPPARRQTAQIQGAGGQNIQGAAGRQNIQGAGGQAAGRQGVQGAGGQAAGRQGVQAAGGQNIQGVGNPHERELGFEELALRASSVVMIAIHNNQGDIIGTGSGIMIGPEGYILTNNHVAKGGRYYSVRIENDDTMYKTDEIIKYNSLLDLAVIRIERRLQPLPIYRGGRPLARGQKVVAIGSPLGLFNSVSDGIISGFRTINDVDMIQFTAPISHGSSGGAVLNMYGEVIGVSTAGFDDGQNINLAVGYEFINTFVQGFQ